MTRTKSMLGVVLFATLLGACVQPVHHGGSQPTRRVPPGYTLGSSALPRPIELTVLPVGKLAVREFHRAPMPADLRVLVDAVVHQPLPTRVQPLLIDWHSVTSGNSVVVVAPNLATGTPHAALFVLVGPHLRAQHPVNVVDGIAAGRVELPHRPLTGQWSLVVVDVSDISSSTGHLSGHVILDAGSF